MPDDPLNGNDDGQAVSLSPDDARVFIRHLAVVEAQFALEARAALADGSSAAAVALLGLRRPLAQCREAFEADLAAAFVKPRAVPTDGARRILAAYLAPPPRADTARGRPHKGSP